MKNRIFKIMGVAVTLAMVLTLAVAFSAPAAANPAEKLNEWYTFDYPKAGSAGDWFRQGSSADHEAILGVGPVAEAINGDLYVFVQTDDAAFKNHIFKSEDSGRSWEATGYEDVDVCDLGGGNFSHPGVVYDMVCSSIDEDVVYATDGFYVYKTDDGGDTWDFLARDSLETALGGGCGCCLSLCISPYTGPNVITSIDVTYDADDNPFVFIGTRAHSINPTGGCSDCVGTTKPGDVYYIGEAGYPANWTSLNLPCFHSGGYDALAVGCAPDWADTKETYVVVTTGSDGIDHVAHTWVVYTKGTVCGWYEFAELLWDCTEHFPSVYASRIGFPDDWEDTETLFVGVVDTFICLTSPPLTQQGGDVYMATDGDAIDLNVAGITTGCQGKESVDILSLDVCGDTDEAALIAGEYCCPNVWYSTDGGWSWDDSDKDPTGARWTYVIWYGDCAETALATTWGCECAVSMTCGEEVGQYWNQISLIATNIENVRSIDHSPGYRCGDSETMFIVTDWYPPYLSCCFPCQDNACYYSTQSVWRHDGTYWERVYCSVIAGADIVESYDTFWKIRVSPDFNETNAVYLWNGCFEMWRTTDAGCSWDKLPFPCIPRPCAIGVGVVIDEDTVIAGGSFPYYCCTSSGSEGYVYKTTRHGARPWDEYEYYDYGADVDAWVTSFALEPGYEDPGTILLGDAYWDGGEAGCHVFISEDGGETWDEVGDLSWDIQEFYSTWVIFDPGYATNHIIYAAAGSHIGRCIIDPSLDWADQEWKDIGYDYCGDPILLGEASGIKAAGDTALYVADESPTPELGVFRSLNPDAEDPDDVVFENLVDGLDLDATLWNLWLTCDTSDEGCAENVLWAINYTTCCGGGGPDIWVYEDTLAQPVALSMPVDEQKLTKTTEATLSWKALCDADCYEVSLYAYCPECPDQKLEVSVPCTGDCCLGEIDGCDLKCTTDETCIVVDDLDPGTTYYWQVRVCVGSPTLSKWSELRSFTTAMMPVPFVDLCSPACGSQDIILTPNFAWGAVEGATGYEVQLSPTETFTAGVIKGKTTVNAWVCPETLEYATTYYWRVRAEKDSIYSDWTYCMFTTMPEPVAPTPPVVVEQVPPSPAPVINIPPTKMITPTWIYAIIGVGAALAIVVIVLIVRTRRPPA
jgi:hypothetical protein